MFNISSLLKKFSRNIDTHDEVKKEISRIIQLYTGIPITSDMYEIKEYNIHVAVSPALKNKLFINKKKILEEISRNIPQKIIDIK